MAEEVEEELVFENMVNLADDWNGVVDDANKALDTADKQLINVLKHTVDTFNEVITSNRMKYNLGPIYGEAIANLVKQRNSIHKDKVAMAEKRLNNNMKLRAIYKAEAESTKKGEDFDPVAFAMSIDKVFAN